MRPLPFVPPYSIVFWAAFVWAFWPEFLLVNRAQRNVAKGGSRDSGSLRLIVAGLWIALVGAFALSFWGVAQMRESAAFIVFCSGLALLVAGSLLRRHCWRVLGTYFTGDVQVRADQPVIERGAYRWVRHPSYTGGILMFAGIGLALGNWASLAVLVIVSIAVYWYRVVVEERELLETIGEDYRRYMRSKKRFIPFIV